jgi:Zn finger protein HypA/HybF involved in hydrogenase expression
MSEIYFTCTYCDHKFVREFLTSALVKMQKCPGCGDSHLKIQEKSEVKIDTYAGSPPFPEEEDDYDTYL